MKYCSPAGDIIFPNKFTQEKKLFPQTFSSPAAVAQNLYIIFTATITAPSVCKMKPCFLVNYCIMFSKLCNTMLPLLPILWVKMCNRAPNKSILSLIIYCKCRQ